MAFTFSPAPISFAAANVIAGATTFPTLGGGVLVWPPAPSTNANFPKANCRQVLILNNGATALYYGAVFCNTFSTLPPPFNAAGVGVIPTLGLNATVIPAGGSLSIELDTVEKRGQFDVGGVAITPATFEPVTLIYFAAAPATNASALVTYINTNGPF